MRNFSTYFESNYNVAVNGTAYKVGSGGDRCCVNGFALFGTKGSCNNDSHIRGGRGGLRKQGNPCCRYMKYVDEGRRRGHKSKKTRGRHYCTSPNDMLTCHMQAAINLLSIKANKNK